LVFSSARLTDRMFMHRRPKGANVRFCCEEAEGWAGSNLAASHPVPESAVSHEQAPGATAL
jgi:hypothetical protein